ncbi:glycosyltransferase family 2 protein [Curtobacterium sp. MCSS17_008]|uniref:glycosyltransferase family 2 protein n=1 Tax=Curtobacterium sp. MCSS17_008 TaxID=2175647 RepID=UPI0015E8AA56|nr:glycosyltransferase family 2 protein [Curtobacterium sp. MCSS17_008]
MSVVLTFHNNLEFVDTALEQMGRLTFENYELFIIDDGSTDGTDEALVASVDPDAKVHLVRHGENKGIASVRNDAVMRAKGEFIWFVDCDDEWEPRILERLVAAARQTGADLVVCGANARRGHRVRPLERPQGRPLVDGVQAKSMVLREELRGYLWNKLIRRRVLLANPFPIMKSMSDFAGLTAYIQSVNRVAFVPEALYTHVYRASSITNRKERDYGDFERCWHLGRQMARTLSRTEQTRREVLAFDYWAYYLNVVNTSRRLGASSAEAKAREEEIRKLMKWRDLPLLALIRPKVALRASAFIIAGRSYGRLHGFVTSLRRLRHGG